MIGRHAERLPRKTVTAWGSAPWNQLAVSKTVALTVDFPAVARTPKRRWWACAGLWLLPLLAACQGPAAVEIRDAAAAELWHCRGVPQGAWQCAQGAGATEDRRAATPLEGRTTSLTSAYQQHAYRPPAPTRLLDLPGNYYALQLAAFDSRSALDQFVANNRLAGVIAVRAARRGELEHVGLAGVYEDRAKAEEARKALPKRLDSMRPWVRRLRSVQRAMRLADDLTGGNMAASVRIGEAP